MLAEGKISSADLTLFTITDDVDHAMNVILERHEMRDAMRRGVDGLRRGVD
jgi:hypothetical protein